MLSKRTWALMLVSVFALMLGACSTEVKRVGVEEVRDLSGNWNDTDSRLVSEEMIRDSMAGGWLTRHEQKSKKRRLLLLARFAICHMNISILEHLLRISSVLMLIQVVLIWSHPRKSVRIFVTNVLIRICTPARHQEKLPAMKQVRITC